MKSKTKAGGIVGAVVAVGIGASMLVGTGDKSKETAKPGYIVQHQEDGNYTVYLYDNVKHETSRMLGKDLTREQADSFLDKKKGKE